MSCVVFACCVWTAQPKTDMFVCLISADVQRSIETSADRPLLAATSKLAAQQYRLWYERLRLEAERLDSKAAAPHRSRQTEIAERERIDKVLTAASERVEMAAERATEFENQRELSASERKTHAGSMKWLAEREKVRAEVNARWAQHPPDRSEEVKPRRLIKRQEQNERELLRSIRHHAKEGVPYDAGFADDIATVVYRKDKIKAKARDEAHRDAARMKFSAAIQGKMRCQKVSASQEYNKTLSQITARQKAGTRPDPTPEPPRITSSLRYGGTGQIGQTGRSGHSSDVKSSHPTPGSVLMRTAAFGTTHESERALVAGDAAVVERATTALLTRQFLPSNVSAVSSAREAATAVGPAPELELEAEKSIQRRSRYVDGDKPQSLNASNTSFGTWALPVVPFKLHRPNRLLYGRRRNGMYRKYDGPHHYSTDSFNLVDRRHHHHRQHRSVDTTIDGVKAVAMARNSARNVQAPNRRDALRQHLHRVSQRLHRIAAASNKSGARSKPLTSEREVSDSHPLIGRGARGSGGHGREKRQPKLTTRTALEDHSIATTNEVAAKIIEQKVVGSVMDVGSTRTKPLSEVLKHNNRFVTLSLPSALPSHRQYQY